LSAEARPWRRAVGWLAFLGPFFFLTYGGANILASHRTGVGSMVFPWERHIPFVGWTIVPYCSIDLLYGLSVFVCATRAELDTHARRLVTAQVVAVTCFIAFPLRFTFDVPKTDGLSGLLFTALASFDRPFNQAPSLHIALLVILWRLYAVHAPRAMLWPLHAWFALIGVSVLTTYQHHFFDVPTGALLGFFCLWAWPENRRSPLATAALTDDRHRRALAARYLAGALLLSMLAWWIGGAGLWLFWGAVALVLVAANYALFGPNGFHKDADGRMSLASRVLLAPYQLGVFINSRLRTRRDPKPSAIGDGVWLGRFPSASEAACYGTIVDLCAELPGGSAAVRWLATPTLDLVTPSAAQLADTAATIDQAQRNGSVLVCCALGFQRSAAAVAAWLVSSGRARNVDEAITIVRAARPRVVIGSAWRAAIDTATRRSA
jgi:hypothetical protein